MPAVAARLARRGAKYAKSGGIPLISACNFRYFFAANLLVPRVPDRLAPAPGDTPGSMAYSQPGGGEAGSASPSVATGAWAAADAGVAPGWLRGLFCMRLFCPRASV